MIASNLELCQLTLKTKKEKNTFMNVQFSSWKDREKVRDRGKCARNRG